MAERHITKSKLEALLKADAGLASDMARERQRIGQLLVKAETHDHLNRWAYSIIKKLDRMDAAKAATCIRALNHYVDLLGLEAQTDLEDVIDADEAREELRAEH